MPTLCCMHVFGLKESLKVTHLIVHVNKIISLHNLLTFWTFDLNVLMKHQGEVGEQLLILIYRSKLLLD